MADNFESIITNNEELRIVMVGKTGVGKSATGNTILGRPAFHSEFAAESLTVNCAKDKAVLNKNYVSVIDTPGLFDTRVDEGKTAHDLKQCIRFASPGPHIFLVVIRLGRFTDEERQTVQKIQEMFGQAADRYSMVLFTGGDQLEGPFEQFLARSQNLKELVAKCNGNYHVLNNKSPSPTQVTELLQKIRGVVQQNGGSHYTNEMFQEAEREVEAEKQRILKENEEKARREREEIEQEMQIKFQERLDKIMQTFQAERERDRKEREEERRKEREEIMEARRREMAELNEERRREREEKQREMTMMMDRMTEQHERQMDEERRRFQEQKEEEARWRAERYLESKEREAEWRREREEMMEDNRKEMERRDDERRREIEKMNEDRIKEREVKEKRMNDNMNRMREEHKRDLDKERTKVDQQGREIEDLKVKIQQKSNCSIS